MGPKLTMKIWNLGSQIRTMRPVLNSTGVTTQITNGMIQPVAMMINGLKMHITVVDLKLFAH